VLDWDDHAPDVTDTAAELFDRPATGMIGEPVDGSGQPPHGYAPALGSPAPGRSPADSGSHVVSDAATVPPALIATQR